MCAVSKVVATEQPQVLLSEDYTSSTGFASINCKDYNDCVLFHKVLILSQIHDTDRSTLNE